MCFYILFRRYHTAIPIPILSYRRSAILRDISYSSNARNTNRPITQWTPTMAIHIIFRIFFMAILYMAANHLYMPTIRLRIFLYMNSIYMCPFRHENVWEQKPHVPYHVLSDRGYSLYFHLEPQMDGAIPVTNWCIPHCNGLSVHRRQPSFHT